MATMYIGSARSNENKGTTGGKKGDQRQVLNSDGNDFSGEVSMQRDYDHSKGWNLFRAKDAAKANLMGTEMIRACNNPHIGYDQGSTRLSLIQYIKEHNIKSMKDVDVDVAVDCAQLVRAIVYIVFGVDLNDYASDKNFYTGNAKEAIMATKLFTQVTYKSVELTVEYNGDIKITKTKGHAAMVCKGNPRPAVVEKFSVSIMPLQKGDKGNTVKALQILLIGNGISCGDCGADAIFGNDTKAAVNAFKKKHGYTQNGIADKDVFVKLLGI